MLGGYLGAGKTTLLNHLLRTTSEPLAVLVNDFGEINIDADLIESHDGETMTLTNGCICCSMSDGLAQALISVSDLDPRPARLIIEASGVADPATIAGYCHRPGFLLDAVVVVVDAETVGHRLADKRVGSLVAGQVRAADIVVLNKVDLVNDIDPVESTVRRYNSDGLLIPTEQSKVASVVLFGIEANQRGDAASPDQPVSVATPPDFESWEWSSERAVDRAWLEQLMDRIPSDVHRMKGVVRLSGDDRKAWVLQRVGSRWSLRPISRPADQVETSTLVAIGAPGSTGELSRLAGEMNP